MVSKCNALRICVLLVVLFGTMTVTWSQERLLYDDEIEDDLKSFIKKLERLDKKPKSKKRKARFQESFTELKQNQDLSYKTASEDNDLDNKNWEGMLNALYKLEYIHSAIAQSKNVSKIVHSQTYLKQIDSISELASAHLYGVGSKYILNADNTDYFKMCKAYQNIYRANSIIPNYENSEDLMKIAGSRVHRKVYFAPVKSENRGTYLLFGSGDSDLSNGLQEEIYQNFSTGSSPVSSPLQAEWIVELTWISINIFPDRTDRRTFERKTTVKEDNKEKEVTAKVTYNYKYRNGDGLLKCLLKINETKEVLMQKEFQGSDTIEEISVSYTGDKRALTNEDLNYINMPHNVLGITDLDLIHSIFINSIQPNLILDLAPILNWNYIFFN